MTGTPGSQPGASDHVQPLLRADPPRLGDIALSGRLDVSDAGIVYAGVLADEPVAVAMLTSGAEADGYARARFHDAVRDARLAGSDVTVVAGEDEPEIAPWVAVRADSWADAAKLAGALLAPVTVEHVSPVGAVRGPAFRPYWHSRGGPGRWRTWPLPWPPSLTATGRWTYVASFALVLAIASVALFIAVQLFDNQPPAPVGPPFPAPSTPIPTERPTPSTGPTSPSTRSPSIPGGTRPGGPSGSPQSPGGTGNTSIV
jgi:hypothetical protein